jgi:hypothetical protein
LDAAYLRSAGLEVEDVEPHDEALTELVQQIRVKLLGAEIMVGLQKLDLPSVDFSNAKQLVRSAFSVIRQGQLGYAILVGSKSQTAI